MIKATAGKPDPDGALSAAKGLSWTSPRGPVRIDPQTRDIIQNVYLRVVERDAAGRLVNRETETFEAQPDYGLELSRK
jgi:branched-chain amino acid transport system substrate-binding protein